MRFPHRIIWLTLLGLICFSIAPALAQNTFELERLEVSLWPEYDRPAVLVIYKARLASTSSLPAIVNLPIPASVGEPHAVAVMSPDNVLEERDYTREVEAEWAMITLETDQPEIWIEFYADYSQVGDRREFVFQWPGGINIGALNFDVQQPLGARALQISPAGQAFQGADGFTYYRDELGPLDASSTFAIELSYTKAQGKAPISPPQLAGLQGLDRLEVSLWPDYDRAAVLVIYRVSLSPDTPLPAKVSLPIPNSAGEPHAVAIQDEAGNLFDAEFERSVQGDWSVITIESGSASIWLEFYSDLDVGDDQRSYTFTWPGGLELASFLYEVQKPVAARSFLVSPAGVLQQKEDGMTYAQGGLEAISASEVFSISFSYRNPSAALSIDSVQGGSSLIRPEGTLGRTPDLTVWLPWAMGGLGVVLVVIGVFFYLRLNQTSSTSGRKPRRRRKPHASQDRRVGAEELDVSTVFCHKCGTRAAVNDHFCRRCGTSLRS